MCIANLDARQRGPEDGRRPPAGVRHREVPRNLSRRVILKLLQVIDLQGFLLSTDYKLISRCIYWMLH